MGHSSPHVDGEKPVQEERILKPWTEKPSGEDGQTKRQYYIPLGSLRLWQVPSQLPRVLLCLAEGCLFWACSTSWFVASVSKINLKALFWFLHLKKCELDRRSAHHTPQLIRCLGSPNSAHVDSMERGHFTSKTGVRKPSTADKQQQDYGRRALAIISTPDATCELRDWVIHVLTAAYFHYRLDCTAPMLLLCLLPVCPGNCS